MSIKEIITVPDPILKKISSPIEKISINEKKLIKDLKDTMYNANGIGLAAIQIGIPKRIVIVDVTKEDEKKNLHCLINPKIKKFSDDRSSYEEGCLSIPNTFIQIERPREIEIEYIDENGLAVPLILLIFEFLRFCPNSCVYHHGRSQYHDLLINVLL